MADKYLKLEQLSHYNDKIKETYVAKEKKTGSEDEYKVLSDNNLTDELLEQIHNAGDSGFNGAYSSLTGKPAIDGKELATDSTAKSLNLVQQTLTGDGYKAEIFNDSTGGGLRYTPTEGKRSFIGLDNGENLASSAKAGMSVIDAQNTTYVGLYVDDDRAYYHNGAGNTLAPTEEIVTKAGIANLMSSTTADEKYLSKSDAESDYLKSTTADETYLKSSDAESTYLSQSDAESTYLSTESAGTTYATKEEAATKSELESYAKSEKVTEDIEAAKTEIEGTINAKIGAAYKVKGSTTFAELPVPSKDTVGDVYNVSDAFVTDDKFNVESQSYPAGTNVVVTDAGGETYKYDALSGAVDLSGYALKSDFDSITNDDIDALFASEAA